MTLYEKLVVAGLMAGMGYKEACEMAEAACKAAADADSAEEGA